MTELEQLKAMLDRAEIVYEEKPPQICINGEGGLTWETVPGTMIEITAKDGPNQHGYSCFVSNSIFDEEGKLVEWGVWE